MCYFDHCLNKRQFSDISGYTYTYIYKLNWWRWELLGPSLHAFLILTDVADCTLSRCVSPTLYTLLNVTLTILPPRSEVYVSFPWVGQGIIGAMISGIQWKWCFVTSEESHKTIHLPPRFLDVHLWNLATTLYVQDTQRDHGSMFPPTAQAKVSAKSWHQLSDM